MLSKSERETGAAMHLVKYLKEAGHQVSFERGADPPDFVFHVDDKKWQVEVTELHQEDENGVPYPATYAASVEVTELVKEGLKRKGIVLEHLVFLSFERAPTAMEKKDLVQKLIDFIPTASMNERHWFDSILFVWVQGGTPDVKPTSMMGIEDKAYFEKPFLDILAKKIPKLVDLREQTGTSDKIVLLIEYGIIGSDVPSDMYEEFLEKNGISCDGIEIFISGYRGITQVTSR